MIHNIGCNNRIKFILFSYKWSFSYKLQNTIIEITSSPRVGKMYDVIPRLNCTIGIVAIFVTLCNCCKCYKCLFSYLLTKINYQSTIMWCVAILNHTRAAVFFVRKHRRLLRLPCFSLRLKITIKSIIII